MNNKKPLPERIWDLFSSIKLSIYLLIILAVLSIFAIYLQEIFPPQIAMGYWEDKLPADRLDLYLKLGMFTPYSSFWYISVIVLLVLNITVCTLNRTKRIFSSAFGVNYLDKPENINQYKNRFDLKLKSQPDKVLDSAENLLKSSKYKVSVKKEDNKIHMFATKLGWGRLGAFCTHTGLVLLFIGGIVQIKMGFRTDIWAGPGEKFTAPSRDFQVRIDDFRIEVNDRGQIKDFLCDLSVLENNEVVKQKMIEVNHPMSYGGLTFYQANYRQSTNASKDILISVKGSDIDTVYNTGLNQSFSIGNSEYSFKVLHYLPHFMMDGKRVYSASDRPDNPAVQIEFLKGDSLLSRAWSFQKFPDMHKNEDAPYNFKFISFNPSYETGLQIVYNPGAGVLWAGFILMTLGIMAAFYIIHKRIWLIISSEDADSPNVLVYAAGNSGKTSRNFEDEFKDFKKDLRSVK